MDIFDQIAERRIGEAIGRGEFDALPGSGRPVELDDDLLVAPELRIAYRILRNAGYVPEEVRLRCELASVERLLTQAIGARDRAAASARLQYLLLQLGSDRAISLQSASSYVEQLARRLEQRRRD